MMNLSQTPEASQVEREPPVRRISAGVREEEVCRILNLKKNLDYSDILIKYASKYLHLGWDLVAVNARGDATLGLDFTLPEELWQPRLTELGMEGVQVNLGLRTGLPSHLLVLEVHREESLFPFNQRGDWASGCVAQVGEEREQHYYLLPQGWTPPPSFFLTSFQIMVFGEGGLVLAPPSLEPRVQTNLRWLQPPWESPPSRLSPVLGKFLQKHSPAPPPAAPVSRSGDLPRWEEIYPLIARRPGVLQALLAPAEDPEVYYHGLLAAARAAGLSDVRLLTGLLWHAPLGDARRDPERWQSLQEILSLADRGEAAARRPEDAPERGGWKGEPSARRGEEGEARHHTEHGEAPPAVPGIPPLPPRHGPAPQGNGSRGRQKEEDYRGHGSQGGEPHGSSDWDPWSQFFRLDRDSLMVDRRRYEAMIYELGKLGAWHEVLKRETRTNKQLREKLESQWTRDLQYYRELALKNRKKGWYRWWQED